jgi:hypothetical protein
MLRKNGDSKKLTLSTETLATLNSKDPQMIADGKTKNCPTGPCTSACATYGCTHTRTCY